MINSIDYAILFTCVLCSIVKYVIEAKKRDGVDVDSANIQYKILTASNISDACTLSLPKLVSPIVIYVFLCM